MHKTKYFGVRIEEQFYNIIDKVAQEDDLDKTSAIKMLIKEGWNELRLKKALEKYREGLVSVDKAAEIAGLTISEMMREIAYHGIKSEETLEEYRKGIQILTTK